jgi:hypothetical protein
MACLESHGVLVLSYLVDPIAPLQVTALKEAASTLGVTLIIRDIRNADDLLRRLRLGLGSTPKASSRRPRASSVYNVGE